MHMRNDPASMQVLAGRLDQIKAKLIKLDSNLDPCMARDRRRRMEADGWEVANAFEYHASPFITCYEEGGLMVFDEIDAAEDAIWERVKDKPFAQGKDMHECLDFVIRFGEED